MKLLPSHSLKAVLGCLGLAVVCYGGLTMVGRNDNGHFTTVEKPNQPYADAVIVDPGSQYFFTWGVTANPRMMEIARTSADNRYGDTYQQSYAVLSQLASDLAEVGLTLRDVVNVRAYLVADPEPDFAGWNKAFTQFFGTYSNPHKPARATVGITRLFQSHYRVEVEFICVFPDGRGPNVDGTRQNERYSRLSRAESSDRWKSFGRPIWPMSTGKATKGGTGLFFSSSVRPASLMPNAPPGFYMFGDISKQSLSLFKQMGQQLRTAGLSYEDVFFIRACVYPGAKSIASSFAKFNDEYEKYFNNRKNPNRPTRTVMSTPGYDYKKQSISIEYYAAYPSDAKKKLEAARESIGETDAVIDGKPIGPAGVAVSPESKLVFVAGSIPSVDGPFADQAASAIDAVKARLEAANASMSDLVQVRAYIAQSDALKLDAWIKEWETLYRKTFDAETVPAVTTLPVVALSGGKLIEIEAMAAIKP